jgi:hypothetical protein
MKRADVFVVSAPFGEGELFAIVRRDEMPIGPYLWSKSLEGFRTAMESLLQNAPILSEKDVRGRLAEMGLPGDDIDDQIDRARRVHAMNAQIASAQFVWETTTSLGYRNGHGQEVRRKTDRPGTLPFQKVYVLHCGSCGHEYGTNGSEIHDRRCPSCQRGMPGLRTVPVE